MQPRITLMAQHQQVMIMAPLMRHPIAHRLLQQHPPEQHVLLFFDHQRSRHPATQSTLYPDLFQQPEQRRARIPIT